MRHNDGFRMGGYARWVVLMAALTACQPELDSQSPESADGLATSMLADPRVCSVPNPGTYAGIDVSIVPYVTGGPVGGFQSTQGTGPQNPITVSFSRDVGSVTITSVDPDYVGNVMIAYNSAGQEIGRVAFDGDNTSHATTRSTKTLTVPGIRSLRLVSAPNDYSVWDSLSFIPTPCAAPSPGTYCGVGVSITPYVTGGPAGGFQSTAGNGYQSSITITFSKAISLVALTAIDPDYANNHMKAYNASGQELARVYFTGDNTPGVTTRSRQSIATEGITRVVLTPDPIDYISYEALAFTESCTPPAPAPYCGDAMCNGTEDSYSCSEDCGPPPPECGDGLCSFDERSWCTQDCGPTCGGPYASANINECQVY